MSNLSMQTLDSCLGVDVAFSTKSGSYPSTPLEDFDETGSTETFFSHHHHQHCPLCSKSFADCIDHLNNDHSVSYFKINSGMNVELNVTARTKQCKEKLTGIVLWLEDRQFVVTLQSRIRGDAELQVSAGVQLIPLPEEVSSASSPVGSRRSSSGSATGEKTGESTTTTTNAPSPPSASSSASPHFWRINISTKLGGSSSSGSGRTFAALISNEVSHGLQYHDSLLSSSKGLLCLYPTHQSLFKAVEKNKVELPLCIKITKLV